MRVAQGGFDPPNYRVGLTQDFMVPKTQDPIAKIGKIRRSFCVAILPRSMLPPVYFDNQPGFGTHKISDVALEQHLTAKLVAHHLAAPEHPPEQGFGIRLIVPQTSGVPLKYGLHFPSP